ncbi:MAG: GNAT family N-acetyltransferase [Rhodospirillaceae bacterium]|nr:MAG: GNAT family N-acetyltransferase [Rhodospirillaceae bacterium]
MFDIRPMRAEDHSAIIRLWHEGWHDAHAHLVPPAILSFRTPAHFSIWLEQAHDDFYVVDGESGLPSGFVSIKAVGIVKLYVDAQARGGGAAPALLSFAENQLASRGVTEAELFCTAGNIRAEKFYARQGWALSGTFNDALWLPEGITGKFSVDTHLYRKHIGRQLQI